ncbi:MAG: MarR family transcriptional regulator [Bacillota bacterium]|nr:MarR family transcriptional regulator [Bacillota bacterium]
MNVEKIKCLLLINENKKVTVTALAKKMNVSKATMSRMINTFYEQGLTLDKGKCQLSKNGREYIEKIQREIKNLTYWLQETSHLNEEEARKEAIKLYTTLNKETIERICSRIHFNQVFDQLGDLVEFSGHYLEHHLETGKYNFSFTLFHYKDANIHSMANRGFEHPAYLLIEQHQGFLVFQPIEMKKELLKERITISSKLKSMKYLIDDREYECFEKNNCFYIPITDLKFFYTKEERLMQTSLTVKLKVNLLKGHMPENLALLKILFH